jgi:hypothetical protein
VIDENFNEIDGVECVVCLLLCYSLSIGDSSSTVIVVDTKIASVAPGRTTTSSMLLQQQRQLMFWCQFHVSTVTPDSTIVFTRKDLDETGQGHLLTDSVRVEMELSSTPQPTSYNCEH